MKKIKPVPFRGQHFLSDKSVLADIVAAAELTTSDTVLEVGPGLGVLTRELAARAGHVVAVELDRRFEPALRELESEYRNVEIVWGDVLKTPLSLSPLMHRGEKNKNFLPLGKGEEKGGGFTIVSNLPYQITTPFLWKCIGPDAPLHPSLVVLLIQREVAERIASKPPDMNLLALLVQSFGTVEIIRRVSRGAFTPPPRVESAVIRIAAHAKPIPFRSRMLKLAERPFHAPRRKVRATLPESALRAAKISPDIRPSALTLADWQRLAACTS